MAWIAGLRVFMLNNFSLIVIFKLSFEKLSVDTVLSAQNVACVFWYYVFIVLVLREKEYEVEVAANFW